MTKTLCIGKSFALPDLTKTWHFSRCSVADGPYLRARWGVSRPNLHCQDTVQPIQERQESSPTDHNFLGNSRSLHSLSGLVHGFMSDWFMASGQRSKRLKQVSVTLDHSRGFHGPLARSQVSFLDVDVLVLRTVVHQRQHHNSTPPVCLWFNYNFIPDSSDGFANGWLCQMKATDIICWTVFNRYTIERCRVCCLRGKRSASHKTTCGKAPVSQGSNPKRGTSYLFTDPSVGSGIPGILSNVHQCTKSGFPLFSKRLL